MQAGRDDGRSLPEAKLMRPDAEKGMTDMPNYDWSLWEKAFDTARFGDEPWRKLLARPMVESEITGLRMLGLLQPVPSGHGHVVVIGKRIDRLYTTAPAVDIARSKELSDAEILAWPSIADHFVDVMLVDQAARSLMRNSR